MGDRRVSKWSYTTPVPRGGLQRPSKFFGPPAYAHGTTCSNQIVHGDQTIDTRKIIQRLSSPDEKISVTRMLTRDLFTVAKFFVYFSLYFAAFPCSINCVQLPDAPKKYPPKEFC